MGQLPAHHITRARLTETVGDASVVLIEAGAGYGKSTLATELVEHWHAVDITVTLHEGDMSAAMFATRLRAALSRAGFTDAAAAMADAGHDPHGAVDGAVDALTGEPCVIVVDDAHHAHRDAAGLIQRMAARVEPPQHAIVLARRLPKGGERLRRGEVVQLGPADLELRADEVGQLCRHGFGLDVTDPEAAALHAVTGGWTAATVLAAARVRRTGEPLSAVAKLADIAHAQNAVAAILDEAMSALAPQDVRAIAQLARVPQLDRATVDAVGGEVGFLDRVVAAGVPFIALDEDRLALPGPVLDFFAGQAPGDPVVLRRVADGYAAAGQLSAALQLLLSAGEPEAATALLADATPALLDSIDLLEFEAVVERVGTKSLERHPMLLVHLARLYDSAALFDKRTEVLDQVDRISARRVDQHLRNTIDVERAIDLMRSSQYADVEARTAQFLEADNQADPVTRARALSGLARAVCWRTDDLGQRDEAAMRRSNHYFSQAAAIYESVGLQASAAAMVPYQAMWIDFALGNAAGALSRIDAGLAAAIARPRKWAFLLSFRGEVLIELGRYDEAESTTESSIGVGDRYGDEQLRAFGFWNQAIIASHLGDADRALERARLVEQHPGEWFGPVSGDFLGQMADDLDRVGLTALASEYLARAQRQPMDGEAVIAMAEAAILARHGDPEQAERCLVEVFSHHVDPRERWRVLLLRAFAAFRRGEAAAGALAARAFEEAARIGLPQLPLTKERDITQAVLALAAETGQPAALALQHGSLATMVAVLGRFTVSQGGRQAPMSAGQGAQLVKLLAVSGRRLPTERVIDALWPEADVDTGRNRLRTVLNRVRTEVGDLIDRDGAVLALRDDVNVDLDDFERDARQALALGPDEPTLAVAVARTAIARYRGDLLPDDPYEPWAERTRERARRLTLELLDLCADIAAKRGDLDEVRRLVEVTIDLAPYDDDRYLRAATTLLEQGRRGAALAVVARARTALAELGLPPPLDLVRIERLVVA